MPKFKCKGLDCKNWTRIPPNREATATGYCRKCWWEHQRIKYAV